MISFSLVCRPFGLPCGLLVGLLVVGGQLGQTGAHWKQLEATGDDWRRLEATGAHWSCRQAQTERESGV